MNNTMNKLQGIFRTIFFDDELEINSETTSNDIERWDSLTHIELIVTIESEFKIKFSTSEISNLKNVGALCDIIENKLKN